MSGEIVRVVWKDEGDFGFISMFTQNDVDAREGLGKYAGKPRRIGVPFDPDRIRQYGSREEAQALAREHGAEYIES